MSSKIINIINTIDATKSPSLARSVRTATLEGMLSLFKSAQDQTGIMSNYNDNSAIDYTTREQYLQNRNSESFNRENLYPESEHEDVQYSEVEPSRSLSTRYSPDRVGVQARRIGDGVYQDPYTNKIYDWTSGFKTESGEEFAGGTVDLQSKVGDNF